MRYIGNTEFSNGVWVGLELNEANGKHDGFCQGKRYFSCKPLHGVFVRAINCRKVLEDDISVQSTQSSVKEVIPRPILERSASLGKVPVTSNTGIDFKKRTSTPTAISATRESRLKAASPVVKRKIASAQNDAIPASVIPTLATPGGSRDSADENFISAISKQVRQWRSIFSLLLFLGKF